MRTYRFLPVRVATQRLLHICLGSGKKEIIWPLWLWHHDTSNEALPMLQLIFSLSYKLILFGCIAHDDDSYWQDDACSGKFGSVNCLCRPRPLPKQSRATPFFLVLKISFIFRHNFGVAFNQKIQKLLAPFFSADFGLDTNTSFTLSLEKSFFPFFIPPNSTSFCTTEEVPTDSGQSIWLGCGARRHESL